MRNFTLHDFSRHFSKALRRVLVKKPVFAHRNVSGYRHSNRIQVVVGPNRAVAMLLLGLSVVGVGLLSHVGLRFPSGLMIGFSTAVCGYLAAVALCNSTTLEVGKKHVTVRRGPLPWPGSVQLDAQQVKGFALEKVVRRTDHGHHSSRSLVAQLGSQHNTRPLLTGLQKEPAKRALELLLEG